MQIIKSLLKHISASRVFGLVECSGNVAMILECSMHIFDWNNTVNI